MDENRRQSRRDRMMLEGEIMKVRDKADITGLVAIQLAFARWIGGIFNRRRAEKSSND
jgi:hypothetical protein